MSKKNDDNSFIDGIKRIAYNSINYDTEAQLIKWWCNKYQLPPNNEGLLAYTLEELLIEYFADLFLDNEEESDDMMTETELNEITKNDDKIININEEFLKRGSKVDLERYRVK